MENKEELKFIHRQVINLFITIGIFTIILLIIGFYTGRRYERSQNIIVMQESQAEIDSIKSQVDSVFYQVKIWKLKNKIN